MHLLWSEESRLKYYLERGKVKGDRYSYGDVTSIEIYGVALCCLSPSPLFDIALIF